MAEPIQIAVTGAAGRLSYALLFRLANGGMFGADQPIALRLMDVPEALPLLEATIMELVDCNFPLLRSVVATTDPDEAFAGADWILLLGSMPYRPGMVRSEALLANAPLYQAQGRAINEVAKTARVLVVANPCSTNCLIAQTTARDVPPEHWFAMTHLDKARAQAMLAAKANVPVDQVARVTVWGDHGPSIFPEINNATIGDRPAPEVIKDPEWVRNVFEPEVRARPQVVRDLRGASPAGAAAHAVLATVRALTTPTPRSYWFSVGIVSDGSYGVPAGLVFSMPIRTEDSRTWSVVQSHYLDEHAQGRIAESVAELEREAAIVTDFMPGRAR